MCAPYDRFAAFNVLVMMDRGSSELFCVADELFEKNMEINWLSGSELEEPVVEVLVPVAPFAVVALFELLESEESALM